MYFIMQNSRSLKEAFDLLLNCDKHDKMQLFAWFKEFCRVGSEPY